jgi:microsomal dipeptidase-like Zn-dependent dipeptidase
MLADMHAHYPMHVEEGAVEAGEHPLRPGEPVKTIDRMRRVRGRPRPDKLRAFVLAVASRLANRRSWWSGPRVTLGELAAGDVRLVFSVLYSPWEEIDFRHPYPHEPDDDYFGELLAQMDRAEGSVPADAGEYVTDAAGLDRVLADGRIAFVHCVEGGFFLGEDPALMDTRVAELRRRGVAYITLAHLFWRKVATNANALPFVPDPIYRFLWRQPSDGLTRRGEEAVRAMAAHGILVDIAHMDAAALAETWELLDDIAPGKPVICSHGGYRCGGQQYMLDEPTVRRIADRGGVIGLIMAQHQLNDGIRRTRTKDLDASAAVVRTHIDRIHDIAGDYSNIALGTDLDGFIKPTMGGIESASDLEDLRGKLLDHYPADVVSAIGHGNAERVLRATWS